MVERLAESSYCTKHEKVDITMESLKWILDRKQNWKLPGTYLVRRF